MSNLAISLEMKSFKELCSKFSPERAIMVRGRPGIGKSQSVYQIATTLRSEMYLSHDNCIAMSKEFRAESSFRKTLKRFWKKNENDPRYVNHPRDVWHYDMGIPVMERRLSQLSESDVVGIPFDSGIGTVFKPTEWLILTTRWPCILFLDELNRAVKQVEQSTFQIADSKAFYGHLLHDETRVYVACNIGDQFDVTPMDPAAISRYAVVDLDPSLEDWCEWARDECDPCLVEFIRSNPKLLEHDGEFEPNKKYPDRRAWANADAELTQGGLYNDPGSPLFVRMTASMVGFAAANAFASFCKERASEISAKEIITNWNLAKKRLPKSGTEKYIQKMIELASKLTDHIAKLDLTDEQAENVGTFMKEAPPEAAMIVWKTVANSRNNIRSVSTYIEDLMVRLVSKQAKEAKPTPPPAAATSKPKK